MLFRITVLFVLLSHANFLCGQDLVVVRAKKAFMNEEKLKTGDVVNYEDNVFIKNRGKLELSGISSKNLLFDDGTYQVGEKHLEHLDFYEHHDSIYHLMNSYGIANCKFEYKYFCEPVLTGVKTYELDRIEIDRDSTLLERLGHLYFAEINVQEESSLRITWTNPDSSYTGKYYILVENLFEEYLELISIESSQLEFDLTSYKHHPFPMLNFTIIAEDCRESLPTALRFQNELKTSNRRFHE